MREGIAPTITGLGEDLPRDKARAALDWTQDGVRVILHEPSMPLAWAIDAGPDQGVFRATWHAERTLGTSPARIPTFADIPKAKSTIRVRAWADDGTLHEATLDVSSPK